MTCTLEQIYLPCPGSWDQHDTGLLVFPPSDYVHETQHASEPSCHSMQRMLDTTI